MSIDTNHEFARGFMTDEEIAEILETEDDLDIDISNLEEELEAEEALYESIDADSDFTD